MLVLTRKNQQSVVVGGVDGNDRLLMVTVLEIRAGSVRLGFDVPAELPVHRLEVWERRLTKQQDTLQKIERDDGQPSHLLTRNGSRTTQATTQNHVLSLFPPASDAAKHDCVKGSAKVRLDQGTDHDAA